MQKKQGELTRYLPGAVLILSGVVIVAFPMLLVAFVSALLILGGIVAIAIAYRVKRFQDEAGRLNDSEPFDGSFWNQAERVINRGRWH